VLKWLGDCSRSRAVDRQLVHDPHKVIHPYSRANSSWSAFHAMNLQHVTVDYLF
jgi:hypothetical protein